MSSISAAAAAASSQQPQAVVQQQSFADKAKELIEKARELAEKAKQLAEKVKISLEEANTSSRVAKAAEAADINAKQAAQAAEEAEEAAEEATEEAVTNAAVAKSKAKTIAETIAKTIAETIASQVLLKIIKTQERSVVLAEEALATAEAAATKAAEKATEAAAKATEAAAVSPAAATAAGLEKAKVAAEKASAASPAAAAASVSSPSTAASVSSPSSSAAQSDVYFMQSWGSINEWYAGDNILDDDTKIKKIIEYQQIFQSVNLGNLRIRPVNGAILSIDGSNKLSYFDYNDFKSKFTQNGGGGFLNKFGFVDEKEAQKRSEIKRVLGLGINLIPKKVVSLLSDGDRLIGMCYSTCGSSDIDREFFGKIETNRLICIKKGDIENVKILFFTGHSLGYIFFEGNVNFDNDGKFIGLKEGTLLRKAKGDQNEYQVLKGTFQGTTVTPDTNNEFLQYGYTASTLSATGYAAGDVGWNLQNPFPLANTTKPGITFLNWNFGPVKVEKKKVPKGDDHGGYSFDSIYYTSHSFAPDSTLSSLISDALVSAASGSAILTESKIEFIKKEGYTDFYTSAKVTLLQLKVEVATGVFCIIELARFKTQPVHRVRIYKDYREAISAHPSSQLHGKVKKHGLFIGLGPGSTASDYVIQFVAFYEVDERGDTTGIAYNTSTSGTTKIEKHLSILNSSYVPKEMKNKPDDCSLLDTFIKQSFDSSLDAADKSYNLFFNTDGVVSILEKYLSPAATAAASTPQDSIKKSLLDEVTAMKTTLDSELKKAMNFVESVEMAESYVGSVKKSSFIGFFDKSPTAGSAVAPSLPAPSLPAPSLPAVVPLTKYIDEESSFFLVDETSINSILTSSTIYTYKSDDTNVAKILNQSTSEVELKKPGTTTITIEDGSSTIATINLTVEQSRQPRASTLTIASSTLTKELSLVGFNLLKEAVITSKTSAPFTFDSVHSNIAEVDSAGDVKLKNVGTTVFTVSDGNEKKSITLDVVAPVLEKGCIATYNNEKVHVEKDIDPNNVRIYLKDGNRYNVEKKLLTPIMSAADVQTETNTNNKKIDDLLSGGKGRRRRSTRKYQKRRGRGNGNNGRRRLTRKVKGQSGGGGGGGGGARRGGKIHRKTKKNVRRSRGGRRGHRRTIKKYHRR
jgi:hypothetical protein